MTGSLIGIGSFSDKILYEIEKNSQIISCDLLNETKHFTTTKGKGRGRCKKIRIQKLRKKWKRKSINYFLVDMDILEKYKKYFIKDSMYLNCNTIYLYTSHKEKDVSVWIERYQRYSVTLQKLFLDDGILLVIETNDQKRNFVKDRWYFMIDTINDILDVIGDILSV